MIHRRSTVYLRPRDKYLQFFLHREILQVLDTSRRKEKASISYKNMMNVSTGTSGNSTSSSYTPTSVLSRVEGITVSFFFLVGSRSDCHRKLSHNWSLCNRAKTSKEESFSGCKHGSRRFDFRSCFLAFDCVLIYRAHVSAMEMAYIIHNVAYLLGHH